jgi:predicted dehydrogenase
MTRPLPTNPSRRNFLHTTAVATGGALLTAPRVASAAGSANGKLRVAVVGVEGRGSDHIRALHELAGENVDLVALCDVHEKFLDDASKLYTELSGRQAKRYGDMREVFDDKNIDAVSFATPNHWHALGTVWGCQAGKDVYVEKPGSQALAEGPLMIAAARRYGRIVQHGTQCRSSENIGEGMKQLHSGAIGRVYMARVVNYKLHAKDLGRHNPSPVPAGLNWDGWVGPGPETPFSNFNWQRYNWRWDFGVGDIGNQGVHQLDLVRWGLKLDTHPTKIQAMGGNLMHLGQDDCQCPCLLSVSYEFGDRNVMVTCETRDGYTNDEAGMGTTYPFVDHKNVCGVVFYGTAGYMIFPDYSSYYTFLGPKRELGPSKTIAGNPMMDVPHFRNWVEAIRNRKPEHLRAEIAEGHKSSALCHLGNVAYRVGRTVQFDPVKERAVNDDEANQLLARAEYRSPYKMPVV